MLDPQREVRDMATCPRCGDLCEAIAYPPDYDYEVACPACAEEDEA